MPFYRGYGRVARMQEGREGGVSFGKHYREFMQECTVGPIWHKLRLGWVSVWFDKFDGSDVSKCFKVPNLIPL